MTNPSDLLGQLEEAIYSKVLEVIRLLRESKQRIVLAESCTGGLVAATFTSIPGVSDVFCGSMVVYRNDTKNKWLGLDEQMLADEKIGPVSPQASEELARKVLLLTPEANLALSITGHLGPNAPAELDGRLFLAAIRVKPRSLGGLGKNLTGDLEGVATRKVFLEPLGVGNHSGRVAVAESVDGQKKTSCLEFHCESRRFRQYQATEILLSLALEMAYDPPRQ